MNLKEILQASADVLMPRICPVCGKVLDANERYICRQCLMELPRTRFETLPFNSMVQRFAGKVPVERATAYFFYERLSPYSQILQDIKYRNVPRMGRMLAKRYASLTMDSGMWKGIDYLIPVPLHIFKLAKRGYNQALHIAMGISDATQIPVYEAIQAVKGHATQTHKSAYERMLNTQGLYQPIAEAATTLAHHRSHPTQLRRRHQPHTRHPHIILHPRRRTPHLTTQQRPYSRIVHHTMWLI